MHTLWPQLRNMDNTMVTAGTLCWLSFSHDQITDSSVLRAQLISLHVQAQSHSKFALTLTTCFRSQGDNHHHENLQNHDFCTSHLCQWAHHPHLTVNKYTTLHSIVNKYTTLHYNCPSGHHPTLQLSISKPPYTTIFNQHTTLHYNCQQPHHPTLWLPKSTQTNTIIVNKHTILHYNWSLISQYIDSDVYSQKKQMGDWIINVYDQ
jgi:hypothetical protein